eukprot:CAMPEP_0114120376 /NCGR_PEP_ID=MMETSP0043_2-20121206/6615_1 /TAXON_ID=464988 /ORGANISM="Hemiselmis andersenii, Strain CCMP644" /LENGTH=107 /DNA_ID=CAMNT_0001212993 /DNA_START=388 /DNA_END=708 /DNA_ORIENTATION=+
MSPALKVGKEIAPSSDPPSALPSDTVPLYDGCARCDESPDRADLALFTARLDEGEMGTPAGNALTWPLRDLGGALGASSSISSPVIETICTLLLPTPPLGESTFRPV